MASKGRSDAAAIAEVCSRLDAAEPTADTAGDCHLEEMLSRLPMDELDRILDDGESCPSPPLTAGKRKPSPPKAQAAATAAKAKVDKSASRKRPLATVVPKPSSPPAAIAARSSVTPQKPKTASPKPPQPPEFTTLDAMRGGVRPRPDPVPSAAIDSAAVLSGARNRRPRVVVEPGEEESAASPAANAVAAVAFGSDAGSDRGSVVSSTGSSHSTVDAIAASVAGDPAATKTSPGGAHRRKRARRV